MKYTVKIIGSLFIVLIAYMLGFASGQATIPSSLKIDGVSNMEHPSQNIDFSLFWDAWDRLEQKFVNQGDLDRQKMVYGAIEGMVKATGDPYTAFFPPEQAKILTEDIDGNFSGIGAEIGFKKEILTVIAPLKNTPAEKAGIRAGDKILEINATSTENLSIEEAVKLIRGKEGTKVNLTIYRDGFSEPKVFTITRQIINIPSVEWEKKGDVAYIQLFGFVGNVDDEFRKAARQIIASGAKKIVLDMRNNPGGYLDSAVEIASYFIPQGDAIVSENFGNGERKNIYRSKGYRYFQKMPVVVLIDGGSASASEIVAGALLDNRGATLVGTKSFGKGSVQEVIDLPDNTILKITVAKWLTPLGRSIQDQGIDPDVEVKMTAEDRDKDKDPQLDKAMEIINAK